MRDMRFTFEERLPNLINGTINTISTDIDYKIQDNGNKILISGEIVVKRIIRTNNRKTEIKDYIPIDISIPRNKLIKKTTEVSFLLEKFRFDLEGDCTLFEGEAELTNVNYLENKEENDVYADLNI
jgi:hypothetical protein